VFPFIFCIRTGTFPLKWPFLPIPAAFSTFLHLSLLYINGEEVNPCIEREGVVKSWRGPFLLTVRY
jgi:hypothetical protein